MSVIRGLIQVSSVITPSINLFRKSVGHIGSTKFFPTNGLLPTLSSVAGLRTHSGVRHTAQPFPKAPPHQQTVAEKSDEDEENAIKEVISKVNSQIANKSHGRLFAVIQLFNRQWKITPEDTLVVQGYWPPKVGDTIRLEKVLLLGSSDFTLVGMPLLRPDLVNIQATIVEKRLSHTITSFKKKRRKQYQRIHFIRDEQTMIRINSITLTSGVNERKDVEGLEGRVF